LSGQTESTAGAFNILGIISAQRGDYATATRYLEDSLGMWRQTQSVRQIARVLRNLADNAAEQGEHTHATELLDESLLLWRKCGDSRGTAAALSQLAELAVRKHEHERASPFIDEALVLWRQLGDRWGIAWCLRLQARVMWWRHDFSAATRACEQSISLLIQIGHTPNVPSVMEDFAQLLASDEQYTRAAIALGCADAIRSLVGAPVPPADQSEYLDLVEELRTRLGETALVRAWRQGAAMTPEEAIVDHGAIEQWQADRGNRVSLRDHAVL
jgi:tetratricopeptide (TPR) repeat protein